MILGIAILAGLDILGVITMIADPDLVERVIPALACVQIFGFVVIAFVSINAHRNDKADSSAVQSSSKEWVLWIFGGIALLYFMRAGLAAFAIAADGSHSRGGTDSHGAACHGRLFSPVDLLGAAVNEKKRIEIKGRKRRTSAEGGFRHWGRVTANPDRTRELGSGPTYGLN